MLTLYRTFLRPWTPVEWKKKRRKRNTCFWQGSNLRPSACKADVITTTLQKPHMNVALCLCYLFTRSWCIMDSSPGLCKCVDSSQFIEFRCSCRCPPKIYIFLLSNYIVGFLIVFEDSKLRSVPLNFDKDKLSCVLNGGQMICSHCQNMDILYILSFVFTPYLALKSRDNFFAFCGQFNVLENVASRGKFCFCSNR